jgi:twinkle protein
MIKKSKGRDYTKEPKPCSNCRAVGGDRSGNNLIPFNDGKWYCFACNESGSKVKEETKFLEGDYFGLDISKGWLARCISLETCRKAEFKLGQYTGTMTNPQTGKKEQVENEWVQIATWKDSTGKIIAQKLRNKNKWFKFLGNGKDLDLWGINDYVPSEKLFIVITGGELDRLSVMQAQGLQYPVVSPPSGEGSAYKAIKKNLKFLMGYKYVVLALDNDEAGHAATKKAIELFEINKVRVCTWGAKDANELLKQGRDKELVSNLWSAKTLAPDSLVTVKDIRELVLKQPQFGVDYPWDAMTKATYGFQFGEIHIVVGANGIGKTEMIKDLMFHFLDKGVGIGLFSFEQDPEDTLRRLVGAKLGIKLHLPGEIWNTEEINRELDKLDDKIYLCKHAGSIDHDELFRSIKYLALAKDKKLFFIDNIRGLGIGHDTEIAGAFMRKLQTICRSLRVTVFLLSHVAKDKYTTQVYTSTSPKNKEAYDAQTSEDIEKAVKKPGMDWESGRMPTTVNIDGPSVFGDLANYIWALARNKVSEDIEESHIIKVKALKTRLDGEYTGIVFKLRYTNEGKLIQQPLNLSRFKINNDDYLDEVY